MVNSLLAVSLPSTPSLPTLSTDALIVVTVGLVIAYSVLAGYAALVRESISVYVGLVLAAAFGRPLYDYLWQSTNGNLPVDQTVIQLTLLGIPIVLLMFGRRHTHGAHKHNIAITLALAVATAMLLVSSVLIQFDDTTRTIITAQSYLAGWIYDFRLLWLGAVPVLIGASALIKPRPHHHRK